MRRFDCAPAMHPKSITARCYPEQIQTETRFRLDLRQNKDSERIR